MKKIVLSTFGSFGDIHPYVAIALELRNRGHHPVIATSELYREKMNALGLELHAVRPVLPSFDQPDEVSRMVNDFMDAKKGTERIFNWLMPHLRDAYEDTLDAVRDAELLLTHPLPFVGPIVAQKTGIRWVSSVLAPISFFSAFDPPVPPQYPGIHHVLKRSVAITRAFKRLVDWKVSKLVAPIEHLRAEVGLPEGRNPLFEGQHSPTLVLALFSTVLGQPQPDWPPNTRVTGFPFYDRRDRAGDETSVAPALLEFLETGEPPVIFTLGSSAFWAAEDFYTHSIKAARIIGRRALLLIGDERNRPAEPLPEGVAVFEYAPFGEVFPRACAVVHQGGVGTTGQALRAGRPALIVPFSHDQFDNGTRVERAGCGRMLPRSKYDAESAASILRELLENGSYTINADNAGRLVRAEDGAQTACDLIEDVMGR